MAKVKSVTPNTLTIKATGDVDFDNINVIGNYNENTNQLDIQTAASIKITNSDLAAGGYNGIMIGQGDKSVLPSSIIIENCKFNTASGFLTNNTINIFGTAENAEILIKDCQFGQSSNQIRFGNNMNVSGVSAVIENCKFDKWDNRTPWQGCLTCECFQDWTETTVEFPPISGETNTKDPAYRKRVLPELIKIEDANNRFGKDKLTIIFKNCEYKGVDGEYHPMNFTEDTYNDIFGSIVSGTTDFVGQVGYLTRYSSYTTINAAFKEKFNVSGSYEYPDGFTWSARPLPYNDKIDYLAEIMASGLVDLDGEPVVLKNENSECYPTIIFEYTKTKDNN